MKNILYFILGIILIIGVSATTVSVVTTKPTLPSKIFVKVYEDVHEAKNDIMVKYKEGWILKTLSTSYDDRWYNTQTIVVMEKY